MTGLKPLSRFLLFVFSLHFFPLQQVLAQAVDFFPAVQDSARLAGLYEKYQQQYQEELRQLPPKNKKDFEDVYRLRWKNIEEKFDKKEICTEPGAQDYLNRMVAVIRQGNPVLADAGFSCYFSRSAVPNAAYIGEGIILFNMGLFRRLDDESQVAFVLCHEIAHFLLHHSGNSIREYVTAINSKEVQAALRSIKGSEYRKREQLEKLVKGLTFDSRRHSRDHEAQADSMAVELMRHTPFALSGALSALALLDTIDKDTLDMASCLQAVFNAPEYPFRKKWIRQDDGLLGGHARTAGDGEIPDSLKTHPDCKKRIVLLTSLIKGWTQSAPAPFVVDQAVFTSLKNTFHYETIEYAYSSGNYTESLFLTLEWLRTNANDAYLVTHTGRLLNGIYKAQKSHTLSRITDLPAPDYPPDYNLLLQFIQNLYLEDLASLSYYYLKQYRLQMDRYLPFREVYLESEKLVKN